MRRMELLGQWILSIPIPQSKQLIDVEPFFKHYFYLTVIKLTCVYKASFVDSEQSAYP